MQSKEPAHYNCPINEWPKNDRPREKMMELGGFKLNNTELLAILIRTGTGRSSAVDIARKLLKEAGGLYELSGMNYREILDLNIKGIGKAKAVTIDSSMQLAKRIESAKNSPENKVIKTSTDVADMFVPRLKDLKKEKFMVVLLASNNKIIKEKIISEGTVNASVVTPREVFYEAINSLAAALILIHNHPSGNKKPSKDDINLTKKMIKAGKNMDIPVLDHIIIGGDGFFSMANNNILF